MIKVVSTAYVLSQLAGSYAGAYIFLKRDFESPHHSVNATEQAESVPMLLHCPLCSERHIDEGEFATKLHHTHACQSCGHVWRPAIVPTCGVQFLPGFKNETP